MEESGIEVDGLCGTSSGALAGALWAAGWPAEDIYGELCGQPPIGFVRPHPAFWRGLFSLSAVVERLRSDLPAKFEDLKRPFGVGVVQAGNPRLLTSGDLPLAVAASCAIPYVFSPVLIEGDPCSDGGALDRTALSSWRAHRPGRDITLHLVDRSSGSTVEPDLDGVRLVRSSRSGAQFWSLGDTRTKYDRTRAAALAVLG